MKTCQPSIFAPPSRPASPALLLAVASALALSAAACGGDDSSVSPTPSGPRVSFFVSSAKSTTGNLGGLRGADGICQNLATAAGHGGRTWRAYLSVERDPNNNDNRTDARSRIGSGPWFNANGALIANNLNELHSRPGDAALFLDERGQRVPGQWAGSPSPNEHDILTGSSAQGTLLAGLTCSDWTSAEPTVAGQVGHSDGLGPGGSAEGALSSWNSSHTNQNCSNTAPRGGAGRIYCFAVN
jgi:hypothetical protein